MNWLDIVILVFLFIGVISGLKAGLIKAVLSLAGIILGIYLAARFYLPLSQKLTFISSETGAKVLAFIIIALAVMILASILAAILGRMASALTLGWANHLGGAIFGLVFGAVIITTVLELWVTYIGMSDFVSESRLASLLLNYFPLIPSALSGQK